MSDELEKLSDQHDKIETKIFEYGLTLLIPWYKTRQQITKKIPNFWTKAIDSSEVLSECISFEDNEAFDSLTDLYVEWDDQDVKNYTVHFTFADNKFFKACTLSKKFICENGTYKTYSVPIEWNPGYDLAKDDPSRDPSFFRWFSDTSDEAVSLSDVIVEEIYPHAINFYNAAEEDIEPEYDLSD